jgi:seryl-tRNA synthetase
MLDIRKIRENPDLVREKLARRHTGDEKLIGQIVALDEEIRKLKQQGETLKSERNKASKEIGAIKAKGGDIAEASAKVKAIGEEITQIDASLATKEIEITDILLRIPNLTHDSVPEGTGAADNRTERVIGEAAKFDFKPKPHWEIGTALGMLDLDAATKISGSGFIVFKGKGARLERALISYLLDLHTTQHGYTEVSPPFLVRAECMVGTSQFPKFIEQQYAVTEEPPLFLVPTAEVPVRSSTRRSCRSATRPTRRASAARQAPRAWARAGSSASTSSTRSSSCTS